MAEISNNLIAGLLIVAIVVSIVGLANTLTLVQYPITYTGAATSGAGKTNLTIESAVSIILLKNESLFGTGYPNAESGGIIYIWSNNTAANYDGTAGSGSFNNGSQGNGTDYQIGTHVYPFVVQNNGNDPATCIQMVADKTAAQFIGGSAQTPIFQWSGMNNESTWSGASRDPCAGGTLRSIWTNVAQAFPVAGGTEICTQLNHTDTHDELRVHFRLGIPEDASGGKSTIITMQGCNPCGSCS